MEIHIPEPTTQKLAQHAAAAGYEDVEDFINEILDVIADDPETAELFRPLSEEELAESLTMCDRGMADAAAGKGRDAREAMQDIAEKYGLTD